MGSAFSKPAKRGSSDPRCFNRSSTCHAPKGAAARCCSVEPLAGPAGAALDVAPFFWRPANRDAAMTSFAEFESTFLTALPKERSYLQGLQGKLEAQLSAWIEHIFRDYLGYSWEEILHPEG